VGIPDSRYQIPDTRFQIPHRPSRSQVIGRHLASGIWHLGGRAAPITFSQFLRIDQQNTRVEEAGPTHTGVNKNDLYQTPPSWLLPREPSFLWCFPS